MREVDLTDPTGTIAGYIGRPCPFFLRIFFPSFVQHLSNDIAIFQKFATLEQWNMLVFEVICVCTIVWLYSVKASGVFIVSSR